jgi:hypothetical protein
MAQRKRSNLVAHLLRGNSIAAPPAALLDPQTIWPQTIWPQAQASGPWIGHNGGPLPDDLDPNGSWRLYCWTKAHNAAWKTPPREIALRRLARAEQLGMSYRAYTAVILDTGKFL